MNCNAASSPAACHKTMPSDDSSSKPKGGKKKMSEMTEEEQYLVAEKLVAEVIQPSLDLHVYFIRKGLIWIPGDDSEMPGANWWLIFCA